MFESRKPMFIIKPFLTLKRYLYWENHTCAWQDIVRIQYICLAICIFEINDTCIKSQCPSPVTVLQCSRPLPVSLLYFPAGWLWMGGRADLKLLAQTAHSPAHPLMSCFHCFSFAGTMTRTFRNSGHNALVAFVGSVFLLHTTGEFSWLAQTDSNYLTTRTTSASPCRAFTTSSYPSSCIVLSFGKVKFPHVELSGINSNHLFQVCPNPLIMGFHRFVYA